MDQPETMAIEELSEGGLSVSVKPRTLSMIRLLMGLMCSGLPVWLMFKPKERAARLPRITELYVSDKEKTAAPVVCIKLFGENRIRQYNPKDIVVDTLYFEKSLGRYIVEIRHSPAAKSR